MFTQHLSIGNMPAVLYGERAAQVCLYVHGKCGCKEEAESLAALLCPRGFQVLGVDLPEHGTPKGGKEKLVPWQVSRTAKSIVLCQRELAKHFPTRKQHRRIFFAVGIPSRAFPKMPVCLAYIGYARAD